MIASFDRAMRRGLQQLHDNPQLWLTIVVAAAIFASFAFMALRFITIARDAQERLVNVRVGALQDAFAPLAANVIHDHARLSEHMRTIGSLNPTIVEFLVVQEVEDTWRIIASLDDKQVGSELVGYDLLLTLAEADPEHSFTLEEVRGGERFFRTARSVPIEDKSERVIALTRQTLSEADKSISDSIRDSVGILILILCILLFLFFHHARIIDYTALYRQLKEVNTLKDDFISMASHELRTPLTVIRGYVELLLTAQKNGTPPDKNLLTRIDHAAQGLAHLVEDMLDVTRIEQGRMSFDLKPFDPSELITEVCDFMRDAARAKSLALECDVAKGSVVSVDADRLRQVMTNLIGNAIKYTDAGTVSVHAAAAGTQYVIRVSDTGIGIDATEQEKLFGKFHRAPGERVRSVMGTGLGLWITKQMIEMMGGSISVESIKGVGSHFIVSFRMVPR